MRCGLNKVFGPQRFDDCPPGSHVCHQIPRSASNSKFNPIRVLAGPVVDSTNEQTAEQTLLGRRSILAPGGNNVGFIPWHMGRAEAQLAKADKSPVFSARFPSELRDNPR